MTQPLKVKRLEQKPLVYQVWVGLLLLPLVYVVYCFRTGRNISFTHPLANIIVHLLLVVCPIILGLWAAAARIEYEKQPGMLVCRQRYVETFRFDWWMMLMMWPAFFLAIIIGLEEMIALVAQHQSNLTTTAGSALFTMIFTFGLTLFYAALFHGTEEFWASEEGLRCGKTRLVEWDRIHHVSDSGQMVQIYHVVTPSLPFGTMLLKDTGAKVFLEDSFSRHGVQRYSDVSPQFVAVRVLVLVASILMFLFGLWIHSRATMDGRWQVLMLLGLGFATTYLLELKRGMYKITRTRVVVSQVNPG